MKAMKLLIFLAFVTTVIYCDLLDQNAHFYALSRTDLTPLLIPLDPPLIAHIALVINIAIFDAYAPFHSTAVGIYAKIPRFPESQRTTRNKNIAVVYAQYRTSVAMYPPVKPSFDRVFKDFGLDPQNETLDLSTPIGVGNYAAKIALKERENDGMNQYGNAKGRKYNKQPYRDYTGYQPQNPDYKLKKIGLWQPNVEPSQTVLGSYFTQNFIFPQYGRAKPIAIDPKKYKSPPPFNSFPENKRGYKNQTDEILYESRNLNDYRKMVAEHFDNKPISLAIPIGYLARAVNFLTIDDTVVFEAITNFALFDAGLVVWKEKLKYDSVRPFSSVRYLYGDKYIKAWGGPGQGTVSDITGDEWISYIRTAAHPDYPSGSACFCAAQFESAKLAFGTNSFFNYTISKPKGSSIIEPGITPAKDIVLGPYNTIDDYIDECANSRFWGGVHFRASIEEGKRLCRPIGVAVYNFIQKHLKGDSI